MIRGGLSGFKYTCMRVGQKRNEHSFMCFFFCLEENRSNVIAVLGSCFTVTFKDDGERTSANDSDKSRRIFIQPQSIYILQPNRLGKNTIIVAQTASTRLDSRCDKAKKETEDQADNPYKYHRHKTWIVQNFGWMTDE